MSDCNDATGGHESLRMFAQIGGQRIPGAMGQPWRRGAIAERATLLIIYTPMESDVVETNAKTAFGVLPLEQFFIA